MGAGVPVIMAVDQHDGTIAGPNLDELGRPLLAAEVKDLVVLNGPPAEDGDPLPRAAPAGLRTDVDRVAAEFTRQPVGGARARPERACDFLEGDQVESEGVQSPDQQGPSLLPSGEVVEDVDRRDTEDRSHVRDAGGWQERRGTTGWRGRLVRPRHPARIRPGTSRRPGLTSHSGARRRGPSPGWTRARSTNRPASSGRSG